MAGKKTLFSLDPHIESLFRERIYELYGKRKGILSQILNRAIADWLEKSRQLQIPTKVPSDRTSLFPPRDDTRFQIVFRRFADFFSICGVIASIAKTATLRVEKDKISFRGTDESHSALLGVMFLAEDAQLLNCRTVVAFGIDITEVLRISNALSGELPGEIFLSGNILHFRDSDNHELEVVIHESKESQIPLPKLGFECRVMMEAGYLRTELENRGKCGHDYITITCRPEGEITLSSSKQSKFDTLVRKSSVSHFECKSESRATYSIPHLVRALKNMTPYFRYVEISFSTNMPMRIRSRIGKTSDFLYHLAPRKSE